MNFIALHSEIRKKIDLLWSNPESLIADFKTNYPEVDYSAFEVQVIELAALLRVLIDANNSDISKYKLPYQRVEINIQSGMTTALARLPEDAVDGHLSFRDLVSVILHHCRCDIDFDYFVGDVCMRVVSPERINKNINTDSPDNSFMYQISLRDFLNFCSDIEKLFSSKEIILKKLKTLLNSRAPETVRGILDNLQLLELEVRQGTCELTHQAEHILGKILSLERIDGTLIVLYKSDLFETVFTDYYKQITDISESGTTGLKSTAFSFTKRCPGTIKTIPLMDLLDELHSL
jgi:hypothetical protein